MYDDRQFLEGRQPKAAGGYVSTEERDKKYKKIEKVYNVLLRKRSKTNP